MNLEQVLKRVPQWAGKSITYVPIEGGITNHNYKVDVVG